MNEGAIPDEPHGLRQRCWAIFIVTLILFLIPLPHVKTADGQLQPEPFEQPADPPDQSPQEQ